MRAVGNSFVISSNSSLALHCTIPVYIGNDKILCAPSTMAPIKSVIGTVGLVEPTFSGNLAMFSIYTNNDALRAVFSDNLLCKFRILSATDPKITRSTPMPK